MSRLTAWGETSGKEMNKELVKEQKMIRTVVLDQSTDSEKASCTGLLDPSRSPPTTQNRSYRSNSDRHAKIDNQCHSMCYHS